MVKKMNFIVSGKSFEKFMMMVILGTTGDAMDVEMNFFFTFWGLELLKKKNNPKVMGMPPVMRIMARAMFKKKLKAFGLEDPWALIKEAVVDGKMKLIPCSMSMDLMGIKKEDLYDFVEDGVGAAAFLEMGDGADSVLSL